LKKVDLKGSMIRGLRKKTRAKESKSKSKSLEQEQKTDCRGATPCAQTQEQKTARLLSKSSSLVPYP